MALDLLAIEPNKVSTDLSGYITYIYGEGKTGKTTMASKMKNALLLAFEPGYKAIPGIRAQDITSWAQVKQVQRQLRDPKVKEAYGKAERKAIDRRLAKQAARTVKGRQLIEQKRMIKRLKNKKLKKAAIKRWRYNREDLYESL